jgi:hypothetical protein
VKDRLFSTAWSSQYHSTAGPWGVSESVAAFLTAPQNINVIRVVPRIYNRQPVSVPHYIHVFALNPSTNTWYFVHAAPLPGADPGPVGVAGMSISIPLTYTSAVILATDHARSDTAGGYYVQLGEIQLGRWP